MPVSWRVGLVAALVAMLSGCSSDDPLPPFDLANPPTALEPGVEIDVSGRGCPEKGPNDLAQPEQVGVELIALESAADYDQPVSFNPNGELGFIGYAGTVEVWAQQFVATEDGAWTGAIRLPEQLAPGEWRLVAACLTRVERSAATNRTGMVPADPETTVARTYTVG